MPILVTGSLAYDRIAVFPDRFASHILPGKIHQLNVVFAVEKMERHFGGTGGNIAYNLSLLGEKPILLATAGNDFDFYKSWLIKNQINDSYIKIIPDYLTASATIMTDLDDNQITAFDQGAMVVAHQAELKAVDQSVDLAIISPNGLEAMAYYAEQFKKKGVDYIADPGQAITSLTTEALKNIITGSKLVVVNDYEWELVKQKTGWDESSILDKAGALIITLGQRGSKLLTTTDQFEITAYQADQVIDPTGAGDAYRAGLLYGLKNKFSLKNSAYIGAWLASKAVGARGTQNHTIHKT